MKRIFTIYDSKAESYHLPFYGLSTNEGIRMFSDVANDKSTPIGKHPEDYNLFEVGIFNDSDGTFEIYSSPKSLGLAINFVVLGKDLV